MAINYLSFYRFRNFKLIYILIYQARLHGLRVLNQILSLSAVEVNLNSAVQVSTIVVYKTLSRGGVLYCANEF